MAENEGMVAMPAVRPTVEPHTPETAADTARRAVVDTGARTARGAIPRASADVAARIVKD